MAAAFEVIEVRVNALGQNPQAEKKTVAICSTVQVAQSTLITYATAAYQEAVNGSMTIKAYSVRPIDIELPGFSVTP